MFWYFLIQYDLVSIQQESIILQNSWLNISWIEKTSYIDTVRNYELDLNKVKFQKIGRLSTKDINDLNQFIKKTATNDIS